MKINSIFDPMIGQESVKTTLSVYLDTFKAKSRIPFLNFVTQRGGGKSFTARLFRKGLKRPDGSTPKLLELNAASIGSVSAFFEQVYPTWVNNNAVLFCDEVHNLTKPLQEVLLSILEVKDDPIREVTHEDIPYVFDFRKISFISATTDQQKLSRPLRDRLKAISFEEYTPSDLYEIFEQNLKEITVDYGIRDSVINTMRGNPRDAVVKSLDLEDFAAAKQTKHIDQKTWDEFCVAMGVHRYGINHSEKTLLKALAENPKGVTLNGLACMTGFENGAIQKEYETILIKKGLMEVDGKRKLTVKGKKFVKELGFVS